MPSGLSRRPAPPFLTKLLLAASVVLPLCAFAINAALDYEAVLDRAEEQAARAADALHEHALKVFETQELALRAMDAAALGMSWEEIAASEDLHTQMARLAETLPQLDNIWMQSPAGFTMAGSVQPPTPQVDIADRDYFAALRAADNGVYVSLTYRGRVTGHPQFNIAMRRSAPEGVFDGVLTASADPAYFQNYYAGLTEDSGASVTLLRTDGSVLARHPGLPLPLPMLPSEHPMLRAAAAGLDRGQGWVTSWIDKVEKLYAWRRVGQYPVLVSYAVPLDAALGPWRRSLLVTGLFTALAIGALAALVLGAMRRQRLEVRLVQDRFRSVQELALDGLFLLTPERDAEGRIVDFRCTYVNPAAKRLLNRRPGQLMGRKLMEQLPGHGAATGLFDRYVRVVETGKPHDIEVNYAADGVDAWFRNVAVRLGDGLAVSFADITSRKIAEAGLTAALAERDALLAQKELLLKEVNHRVKNSLQLVSSLLRLEAGKDADAGADRRFEEAIGRVNAIAAVHERLYRADDVERVTVDSFLGELIEQLSRTLGRMARIELSAEHCLMLTDRATPLSLLVNELVTNAAKHGRTASGVAEVKVTFTCRDGRFRLMVRDRGPGLPEGFEPGRSKGLGMRVVTAVTSQLGATLSIGNAEPGALFTVEGPLESGARRAARAEADAA